MEPMTIYEIDSRISEIQRELEESVDPETGEISANYEDLLEELDSLGMAREDKKEAIALIIKNRAAQIDAIKAERKRLDERLSVLDKRQDNTKAFLDLVLGGEKFETPKVKCSYRKVTKVEVSESESIPAEYLTYKTTSAPDKKKIKLALQEGEKVKGCELVTTRSLSIK